MRVLIYGREEVVSRVKPLLDEFDIEIVQCFNEQISQDLPGFRENLNEVDLAILDTNETGSEMVINHLQCLRSIPVALLIDREMADWERLGSYEACWYIPHNAGELELACRLKKAISGILSEQQYA